MNITNEIRMASYITTLRVQHHDQKEGHAQDAFKSIQQS